MASHWQVNLLVNPFADTVHCDVAFVPSSQIFGSSSKSSRLQQTRNGILLVDIVGIRSQKVLLSRSELWKVDLSSMAVVSKDSIL